ncbi:uncharacterized protein LOC135398671 [Ornithodoros turicata]|uniref:uncharacterized protein LOC135398671 n=1 Tax=Ornithodoros turicata TaxID=34597 RepID=UPI00313991A8
MHSAGSSRLESLHKEPGGFKGSCSHKRTSHELHRAHILKTPQSFISQDLVAMTSAKSYYVLFWSTYLTLLHVIATASSASNSTKVGATSASWSFPITSSILQTTPPSYLQNHASAYSPLRTSAPTSQTFPHNYYTTPATITTSTTTYSPPYNPLDYYFNGKRKTKSPSKTSQTTAYKKPPSATYYTPEYDDESLEESRESYVSRTDKDEDEIGPTYVRTKYGYATRNPLLADDTRKTSSSSKNKEKGSSSDKHYVAAPSELYGYKGYDYADASFGDFEGHPYPHHLRHKHGAKGLSAFLLGLLPLGLLMAALVPSFVNLPVAATVGAATVGAAGRRRRRSLEENNPLLHTVLSNLDDLECLQRVFCEVAVQGSAPEAKPVQKAFYYMTTLSNLQRINQDNQRSMKKLSSIIARTAAALQQTPSRLGKRLVEGIQATPPSSWRSQVRSLPMQSHDEQCSEKRFNDKKEGSNRKTASEGERTLTLQSERRTSNAALEGRAAQELQQVVSVCDDRLLPLITIGVV